MSDCRNWWSICTSEGGRHMQSARSPIGVRFFVTATVLFGWLSVFPCSVYGQRVQNSVFNPSGTKVASPDFIDASQFGSSLTNICAVLYGILSSTSITYPSSGAVIDARGLPGTTGTSMTCAVGTTPWNNGATTVSVPSTIL